MKKNKYERAYSALNIVSWVILGAAILYIALNYAEAVELSESTDRIVIFAFLGAFLVVFAVMMVFRFRGSALREREGNPGEKDGKEPK